MGSLNFKLFWMGLLVAVALVFSVPSDSFANDNTMQILVAASDDAADDDDDEVNDPLEPVNRAIFEFNEFIYDLVLHPIADIYNENLPVAFRTSVSNFLTNLSTPVNVANHLLQGEPEEALRSVGRFMANSVAGIGGLVDVAAELGDPGRTEDFGQTLGVWGVEEGFYLVLPIFGPSNPRDLVGKFIVDPYFDASGNWISNTNRDSLEMSLTALDGISEYAGVVDELDQIKKTSVDYYAAIRSLYRQKRKSEINNGEQIELPPIPDFGYNLEPEDTGSSVAGTN